MLSGVLLLCMVLAIVASVWAVTRVRGVMGELRQVEQNVAGLAEMLRQVSGADAPVVQLPAVDDAALTSAKEVLGNASPEDLQAALDLLGKMGMQ